jgi:uncharacterized protein (TIGR01244 family)
LQQNKDLIVDIRQITPVYSVFPQIEPSDFAALKQAGFARVICNRPDAENPAPLQATAMAEAAKAAGIDFFVLPLTHDTMTSDNVSKQMEAISSAEGPVLAYCASGTRSSVIWSLGQASAGGDVDEILTTVAKAGYDLSGLRPRLQQLAD